MRRLHLMVTLFLTLLITVIAVPPLIAQTPAGQTPWWVILATPLLPIVTSVLSKYAMDGLKQILGFLDTQSTFVKQVVAVLVSAGIGWLGAHLTIAVPLSGDLHEWTIDTINAILTALGAAGLYRAQTNANLARQGAATLEQRADGAAPRLATVASGRTVRG